MATWFPQRRTAMIKRSRTASAWARTSFTVAFVVLVFGCWTLTSGQEAKRSAGPAKLLPNSPGEAIRPAASLVRAATFLDTGPLNGAGEHRCGPCHTNYPYLVARPVLKEPVAPAMVEIRGFFEER